MVTELDWIQRLNKNDWDKLWLETQRRDSKERFFPKDPAQGVKTVVWAKRGCGFQSSLWTRDINCLFRNSFHLAINWRDSYSPQNSTVSCKNEVKWVEMKGTQSCPALCDAMDYRVLGILQARILEWVAYPFSRGSSQPRDWAQVSRIAGRFFTSWAAREAHEYWSG